MRPATTEPPATEPPAAEEPLYYDDNPTVRAVLDWYAGERYATEKNPLWTPAEYRLILRAAKPVNRRIIVFIRVLRFAREGRRGKLQWRHVRMDENTLAIEDHNTLWENCTLARVPTELSLGKAHPLATAATVPPTQRISSTTRWAAPGQADGIANAIGTVSAVRRDLWTTLKWHHRRPYLSANRLASPRKETPMTFQLRILADDDLAPLPRLRAPAQPLAAYCRRPRRRTRRIITRRMPRCAKCSSGTSATIQTPARTRNPKRSGSGLYSLLVTALGEPHVFGVSAA